MWYLSTSSRGSDWLLACNTPDGTSPSPHRAWMVVRPKSIGKSPSVAHQLDEAAGSPSLFPKALTRLACPATAGHPRLFDLQFPWTNAAEDEAAIRVPKTRGHTCCQSGPSCTLGCRLNSHWPGRERRILLGARGYRSSLIHPSFQRSSHEAVGLLLAIAQVLVEGLRVIMRDQGHPPQLTIAAPCHLHVDHTVGAQGGGQLVARFPKASSGSVIRSSHTARNLICSFESWIPCSGRSRTVAGVRARKTEAAIKMPISLYRSFTSACVCGYRRPTLERKDLISAVLALWAAISEDFFCLMPSPVPLRSGLTNRGISRPDLVDLLERPRMPKDSDH